MIPGIRTASSMVPSVDVLLQNVFYSLQKTLYSENLDFTMAKADILKEFWIFLKVRKKLWLAPIVFVLLLLGLLIVVTGNTALAPFIYALF